MSRCDNRRSNTRGRKNELIKEASSNHDFKRSWEYKLAGKFEYALASVILTSIYKVSPRNSRGNLRDGWISFHSHLETYSLYSRPLPWDWQSCQHRLQPLPDLLAFPEISFFSCYPYYSSLKQKHINLSSTLVIAGIENKHGAEASSTDTLWASLTLSLSITPEKSLRLKALS